MAERRTTTRAKHAIASKEYLPLISFDQPTLNIVLPMLQAVCRHELRFIIFFRSLGAKNKTCNANDEK